MENTAIQSHVLEEQVEKYEEIHDTEGEKSNYETMHSSLILYRMFTYFFFNWKDMYTKT